MRTVLALSFALAISGCAHNRTQNSAPSAVPPAAGTESEADQDRIPPPGGGQAGAVPMPAAVPTPAAPPPGAAPPAAQRSSKGSSGGKATSDPCEGGE